LGIPLRRLAQARRARNLQIAQRVAILWSQVSTAGLRNHTAEGAQRAMTATDKTESTLNKANVVICIALSVP